MKKETFEYIIEAAIVLGLFMIISYFVQTNIEKIRILIKNDFLGIFLYMLFVIIAVVIAPISATPLLPIASNLWGWFLGAVLSLIGWIIGAVLAFFIARKLGVRILKRFVPIERIKNIEDKIPKKNIFWGVVFLRTILPVDLLSYALGLFSKMSYKDYISATILGLLPFAFIFSYIGVIPTLYQFITFVIGGIIFAIIAYRYLK